MPTKFATIVVPFHVLIPVPDEELPISGDRRVEPELPAGGTPWERLAVLYDAVATEVADAASPGAPVAVLSGDCTTSLGTVAGLQRSGRFGSLGIVWFDAHGDLHTPGSTRTGYLGGMPLRMLVGEGDPTVAAHTGLRPVDAGNVVLVGTRDLEPPEREYLATSPIRQVPVDAAAQSLPRGPLYVHVDMDVLDPTQVPGLLYPARGGTDLATLADVLSAVLSIGQVAALGIGCTWTAGHDAAPVVRDFVSSLVTT
ncbi:arginase family protein [Flindersiella endophytica]